MNQSTSYKIIKVNPDNLIVVNQRVNEKYYYKEFKIRSKNILKYFIERKSMNHQSIIQIKQMQINQVDGVTTVGLYFEFYVCNLESKTHHVKSYISSEEILNTFEPIVDAIQFMHKENLYPAEITSRNIVITESGQVKFLDKLYLLEENPVEQFQRQQNKQFDYQQILLIILNLIEEKQDKCKTWKQRVRKIKMKYSKQFFNFIQKLAEMSKFNLKITLPPKTKQIQKQINNQNKYKVQSKDIINKKLHKMQNITDNFLIKDSN